jgi:hypothetical protein
MPAKTLEEAIRAFELHPEFARVQCGVYEETQRLVDGVGPALPGTTERRECALKLFDIRATAFLGLVTDTQAQNAFCDLLAALEPLAWLEYIGHSPDVLRPCGVESLAFVEAIHTRAQRFANEGYKRLAGPNPTEALSILRSTATVSAPEPAGTVNEMNMATTAPRAAVVQIGLSPRKRVEAFLEAASTRALSKVTKTMFWKAAGYAEATPFEDFQEGKPRTSKAAQRSFERLLAMSPDKFMETLRAKKLIG